MTELTVKYIVDDETIEQLKRIQALYQAKGLELTIEEIFSTLMILGSKEDMVKRLDYAEKVLTIK